MGGFGLQYPHINTPTEVAAQQATLGDLLTQRQLRQAQLQDVQAQADQRQRDLQATQQVTDLLRAPDNQKAAANGDYSFIRNAGIPDNIASSAITEMQNHQKAAASISTDQNKVYSEHRGLIQNGIDSLGKVDPATGKFTPYEADPYKFAAQWGQMKSGLAGHIQPDLQAQIPDIDPTKDVASQAGNFTAVNSYAANLMNAELGRQKTKQENADKMAQATKATADAANAVAQLPGIQADAAIKKAEADGIAAPPTAWISKTASSVNPQKYPEIYTRTLSNVNNALTYKDKLAAIEKGSAEVAEREKETDPALIVAAAKKASAESFARLPAEIQARIGVANAMNPTTPELAGVPVAERGKVQDEYKKSLTDMASSAAEANRMHSLVQASQNGNQVTPTLAQLAELRTILNRVTGTEFGAAQGAGSALERVQGWINGKVEGEPIPPQILKDMDATSGLLMGLSEQKLAGEVKAINIARHANLQSKTVEDLGFTKPGTGVSTKYKTGDTRVVNGHTYVRDDKGTWNLK